MLGRCDVIGHALRLDGEDLDGGIGRALFLRLPHADSARRSQARRVLQHDDIDWGDGAAARAGARPMEETT